MSKEATFMLKEEKVWTSQLQTPLVKATKVVVTHNLNIENPLDFLADAHLQCLVAEHGYSVGEFAQWSIDGNNAWEVPPTPRLYENTIEITLGGGSSAPAGVFILDKNTGIVYQPGTTSWGLIFRIYRLS